MRRPSRAPSGRGGGAEDGGHGAASGPPSGVARFPCGRGQQGEDAAEAFPGGRVRQEAVGGGLPPPTGTRTQASSTTAAPV